MATHELRPVRENLHARFSPTLPPTIQIASGDRLVMSTLDAGWYAMEQADPFGELTKFAEVTSEDQGHALLGPISVEGAQPGDAIEVGIETLRPGTWGWALAGGWPSEPNEALGVVEERVWSGWQIDADAGIATDAHGLALSIQPFLGWIGLMPAAPGPHSTTPPRRVGGNLDCRELVAGTRLFLPVEVEGGLLSLGDGHAVQGDGEVSGVAIECPMERIELTVRLHPEAAPKLPYAATPAGWITLGFDADLNVATYAALNGMVDLMAKALNVSRPQALLLASLKVNLRVTQIVNETKGVHALLPTEALRELGLPDCP